MNNHEHKADGPYLRLAIMSVLSFCIMYLFMYAMVDRWSNVFPNYNQFYMAGLMALPMVILELLLMGSMYGRKSLNTAILVISIMTLVLFWFGIRGQKAIGDEQFLKSMIPHHAGAILMCERASLEDESIIKLCQDIISSQQAEINFMKTELDSIK